MNEKRFRVTISNTNEVSFVDVVENKELMGIIFKEKSDAVACKNALMHQCNLLNTLNDENEQLKKELHLMHIRTMFSTVQSFKGDVSERYTYSDETDTIYDTANHYGQYNKVLDKKEIVMLLNEYETILKELKE